MNGSIDLPLLGQTLTLSHQRGIYWKEASTLLVADVHLGKAGHFRKAGIPVSSQVHLADLQRLSGLIREYMPEKLVLLGDVFHSDKNREWEAFSEWRQLHADLAVQLTKGNHDVIPASHYLQLGIEVVDLLHLDPFVFSHHPQHDLSGYNLAGHVHPGIHLAGRSRQGIKLPCFYFGVTGGLLPAFGNFTGCVAISPQTGDKVYAVTPSTVMRIQ